MNDSRLVGAYQWVVDSTEKKPAWLATQTMMVATCTDIVAIALRWKGGLDFVLLLLILCCSGALILATRNEAMFRSIGESLVRLLLLALTIGSVFILFVELSGSNILRTTSNVFFMSYYYFACCEAPRPKKRKEKLVMSAA